MVEEDDEGTAKGLGLGVVVVIGASIVVGDTYMAELLLLVIGEAFMLKAGVEAFTAGLRKGLLYG